MAENKWMKLLKDNWIGGVIGLGVLWVLQTYLALGIFATIGLPIAVLYVVGYIAGAFIQSNNK